jgi:hypothetical protein
MTPSRRALFVLAENLGMTMWQLERALPVSEIGEWIEYYDWKQNRHKPQPEELNEKTLQRMFK